MNSNIPEKLIYFFKNAIKDVDDGYEYASELNRILSSDDCQMILSNKEIDTLRDYADKVKEVGEINHYSEERIKEIEKEHFGNRGVLGFLGASTEAKPQWPF